MNVNKVFILGNLTRDPEARTMPSGNMVVNLGVATNRFWTNQGGEKQKQVEFHNVVLFGKTAEIAKQYLSKGKSAFIEGRLQTRSWEGQDGVKKYRTEIIAERLQLGPRNFQPSQQGDTSAGNDENKSPTSQNDLEVIEYPEEDINPEDIPF